MNDGTDWADCRVGNHPSIRSAGQWLWRARARLVASIGRVRKLKLDASDPASDSFDSGMGTSAIPAFHGAAQALHSGAQWSITKGYSRFTTKYGLASPSRRSPK